MITPTARAVAGIGGYSLCTAFTWLKIKALASTHALALFVSSPAVAATTQATLAAAPGQSGVEMASEFLPLLLWVGGGLILLVKGGRSLIDAKDEFEKKVDTKIKINIDTAIAAQTTTHTIALTALATSQATALREHSFGDEIRHNALKPELVVQKRQNMDILESLRDLKK